MVRQRPHVYSMPPLPSFAASVSSSQQTGMSSAIFN